MFGITDNIYNGRKNFIQLVLGVLKIEAEVRMEFCEVHVFV